MTPGQTDPGPADQSLRAGGSRCLLTLAQFFRIFFLILSFSLSGCSLLQSRDTATACVVADVATTIVGVSSGRMVEVLSPVKASINAGQYGPMILLAVGLVMLVRWLDEPVVNAGTSVVECGLALNNLAIIW